MRMTKEKYEKLLCFFSKNSIRLKMIRFFAKYLPLIEAAVYLIFAVILLSVEHPNALRFLIIPAVTFVLTTVIRRLINRRRPYEVMGFEPLLDHQTDKRQSFPSRHTVSAWIIAFVFLEFNIVTGICAMIPALLISASRICTGMHYPSDVLGGFIFAAAAFAAGMVLI